ncbi:MAG: serine hydrolase domain-containing protein [Thermonemataceae bacterium]
MNEIISVIFIVLSNTLVFGQTISESSEVMTKKSTLELMNQLKVPAVGIGIIEDGLLKEVKVHGELVAGKPAPYNTIFETASLSKLVVTMLTLTLVTNKDWDLDDPLAQYWVDPDVKNDPFHKKLTTRHVLTHQTGFDNWRWNNEQKKLVFNFEPGTDYKYSGEGFEYLGKALENKFKMNLHRLCDSLLFRNYDMTDSRFYWDNDEIESRYAVGHSKEGIPKKIRKKKEVSGYYFLSTIKDYSMFGINIMNKTTISEEVFSDMVRPQTKLDKDESFGLGWDILHDITNGEYAMIYSGSNWGVRTFIMLLPYDKSGLVVFTNGDNGFDIIEKIVVSHYGSLGKEIVQKW